MVQQVSNGVTGNIGGQPKQRYWTPDGREIRAMPDMHEYARRDTQGKVIENGVRDANLDKGWFPYKPQELKPYCPHCDRWHDTEKEIKQCGARKEKLLSWETKRAKRELKVSDDERITKLETALDEIKALLQRLVK